MQYIDINTINTWEVTNFGNNIHPLHVHVNHFQMISSQLSDLTSSDYDNWVDIPYGFKTDIWAGTVTLHCHIAIHEDQGAMGTIKINNGCDSEYNDYSGDNLCDYSADKCDSSVTSSPTSVQTPAPTETPSTSSPTADVQTNSPTTNSPTTNSLTKHSPTRETTNPTIVPTVNPTTLMPSEISGMDTTDAFDLFSTSEIDDPIDGNDGDKAANLFGFSPIYLILSTIFVLFF